MFRYEDVLNKIVNYKDNKNYNHRKKVIWDIVFLEKLSLYFKLINEELYQKNDFFIFIDEITNKILLINCGEKILENSIKDIEHIHEKYSSWDVIVILPAYFVYLQLILIQKIVMLYNVKFYEDDIY